MGPILGAWAHLRFNTQHLACVNRANCADSLSVVPIVVHAE